MSSLVLGADFTQNGAGQYTFNTARVLAGTTVTISHTVTFAGFWQSALSNLGLSLASGAIGQPVWSWLQNYKPAEALAYSGMAYVYADAYPLTNQAEVENHSFEVVTGHAVSSTVLDCWPDRILKDFLVFDSNSIGWREGRLAPMTALISYTRARQLWLSVAMTQQRPGREWLEGLAMTCNAEWTWQGGLLDLVPRGDEAISSAYGSYAPITTPVFDLAHGEGGDLLDPVEVIPRINEDAFNIIKIEWTNRANGYTIEVMTASDAAHIEQFGERPKDVMQMHHIHDPAVAQGVAQQILQREMTVWNTYRFKTPYTRALIGLMDLCTLTDADSELLRTPVRILKREESGRLEYTFEAEDAPIGSASAPLYGTQAGAGFGHDYNAAPGNVAPPAIFEAPPERTASGLEVYAAVSGLPGAAGALWGGCSVHVSLDGLNYRNAGRLYGGARYGQLTAAMGANGNAAVSLAGRGGQMLSGSAQDAAALSTLCWVSGSQGGEYFAYQTATLTAANAYTLSALTRGAYQNPVAAHVSGASFVRVDDALATSDSLTLEMLGKQVFFKFTSFNVYGGAEQSLSDVVQYSHTITGDQLKLPPPTPVNLKVIEQPGGVRQIFWQYPFNVPDLFAFELAYTLGDVQPPFASMTSLPAKDREARQMETIEPLGDGVFTFAIVAVDTTGNRSEPKYLLEVLDGDLFGQPLKIVLSHQLGWPGQKVDCFIDGAYLSASGLLTWDAASFAWDQFLSWDQGGTVSQIQYTENINCGSIASRVLRCQELRLGEAQIDVSTSNNDISYGAFAPLSSGALSARYYKVRWTISGATPRLFRAQTVFY